MFLSRGVLNLRTSFRKACFFACWFSSGEVIGLISKSSNCMIKTSQKRIERLGEEGGDISLQFFSGAV